MSPVSKSVPMPASLSGRIEALKWAGLGAMLAEHVSVYVFSGSAETYIGAVAFPLFVACFALALRDKGDKELRRIVGRLAFWCVVAQSLRYALGPQVQVNVLATFALGLAAWRQFDSGAMLKAASLVACGIFVEYSIVGVVLVALAMELARRPSVGLVAIAAGGVVLLGPFNGNQGAWLALPLAAVVWLVPITVPRIRGAFLSAYVVQWPVLWVAAAITAAF